MQGVLLLVLSKFCHLPFLRGVQTESTRTGLGGYWVRAKHWRELLWIQLRDLLHCKMCCGVESVGFRGGWKWGCWKVACVLPPARRHVHVWVHMSARDLHVCVDVSITSVCCWCSLLPFEVTAAAGSLAFWFCDSIAAKKTWPCLWKWILWIHPGVSKEKLFYIIKTLHKGPISVFPLTPRGIKAASAWGWRCSATRCAFSTVTCRHTWGTWSSGWRTLKASCNSSSLREGPPRVYWTTSGWHYVRSFWTKGAHHHLAQLTSKCHTFAVKQVKVWEIWGTQEGNLFKMPII